MALIGEMQYLTIGGNTYSLPVGGGGTVTSVAVSNATNGGLSISGSPISSNGTITIGHSNVLAAAQTTQAVYPIKIDKNGHISAYGTAIDLEDTKVFLVTITQNGDDYVSDKTAEEIINAYNAGRVVIAKTDDWIFPLVYIEEDPNLDYHYSIFAYVNVWSDDPINFSSDKIEIETSNGVTTVNYVNSYMSVAFYYHTHGNITNTGDITTTATIASGDRLVINDESASKLNNSSITFGTSTSQYLANNGTWQNVPSVPTKTSDLTNDSGFINSIKTINNQSLIGSGNIIVSTTAAQIIRWTEST